VNPFLHPDVKLEYALSQHCKQRRIAQLLMLSAGHAGLHPYGAGSTGKQDGVPVKKRRKKTVQKLSCSAVPPQLTKVAISRELDNELII